MRRANCGIIAGCSVQLETAKLGTLQRARCELQRAVASCNAPLALGTTYYVALGRAVLLVCRSVTPLLGEVAPPRASNLLVRTDNSTAANSTADDGQQHAIKIAPLWRRCNQNSGITHPPITAEPLRSASYP